jgi:hypothetical protein
MGDLEEWFRRNATPQRTARGMLVDGPFDGCEAVLIPPDTAAPAQIVWSGWGPHGFTAWLYEHRGERRGEDRDLVYRPTGRQLTPGEIPPVIAADAALWAHGSALLAELGL